MDYFSLFCKDLLQHFWRLMSCAAFTLLAIYVAATNRDNQWLFGAAVALSIFLLVSSTYAAWKGRYVELAKCKEGLASLARRLADTGPAISLKFDRGSMTRFGFMLYSDKEICGLTIKSIAVGNCTFSAEVRPTVTASAGEQVTLRIRIQDPKNGFINESAGTWGSALYTDECWEAFKGFLPLDIEYWDKRGNQYTVRWNLEWKKEFTDVMGDVKATFDPSSYRLMNAI